MTTAHLLPPNATSYEIALSLASSRISDVPVPIETTWRPHEAPASFLPFLAWAFSVDVWSVTWTETRKRAVIAASLRLHKHKGTAYALREYVRYADGKVLAIERPPMQVFSGPSPTREERETWLAGLPQLRVWRIRETANMAALKSFYGSRYRAAFLDGHFPVPSTALARHRRRARWVVDGVETELRVSEFGSYWRVHLPADAGARVFSGAITGRGRFYLPSTARQRLVTIQPTPRLPWRIAHGPTLRAVTSEPERVTVGGTAPASVITGRPIGNYFVRSSAPYRIFQRFAVHDGRSMQRQRAVRQFMGHGRYGWPMHTARVQVSIPGRRSRFAAGEGVIVPRARFWIASNARSRVANVARAVQSAKRLSDRIELDIGIQPRFVAGRPFIAGTDRFVVGYL